MAQPTAAVNVSVTVQVFGRDFTQNPATTIEREETLSFNTTVANYATEIPAFAGSVYARQVSMIGAVSNGQLEFVHGQIKIDDVTGAPSTPIRYSTYEYYATPVASPQQNQGQEANFQLGPNDYTDGTSLGVVIVNEVRKFVGTVGY